MHHSKEEANKLPNNTENCIVGSKVVKLNSEVGREQESGHGTLTYNKLKKGKIVLKQNCTVNLKLHLISRKNA